MHGPDPGVAVQTELKSTVGGLLLVGSISLPGRCLNIKVKVDAWLICKSSSYYVREHVCFLSLCLHTSTFIYTCLHLHLFISGLLYCLFFDTDVHIHTALMFMSLYQDYYVARSLSLSLSHAHTYTHTRAHIHIHTHCRLYACTQSCMHNVSFYIILPTFTYVHTHTQACYNICRCEQLHLVTRSCCCRLHFLLHR